MTTTGVLAGSVGEGGRNDARDVKLVGGCWTTGGLPSGESLPADGDAGPCIDAAIRAFQTGNRSEVNGRVEPGDPTWDALAACHLAGIRSGRIRPDNLAFVPLPQAGDPSLSEADWREAFAGACGGCASGFNPERPATSPDRPCAIRAGQWAIRRITVSPERPEKWDHASRRTSGGSGRPRAQRPAAFPPFAADTPDR